MAPPTTLTPEAAGSGTIALRVGECDFQTTISTLTGRSAYFEAMLSGPWKETYDITKPIFIDRDPEVFKHVLRFLRSDTFPLFWTKSDGFDLALYLAVQREAEYFGIEDLSTWISKKRYVQAIKVTCSAEELDESLNPFALRDFTRKSNGNSDITFAPHWLKQNWYRCPRNIDAHYGDRGRCGKACEKAKKDGRADYEDVEVMSGVIWTSSVEVDHAVCLAD